MKALKQIFSFEDMAAGDTASRKVMQLFNRAHQEVVSQAIDPKIRRTSGQSYREMSFTFADSQTVVFRIKSTGDIYQVVVNGKLLPIKHQDDQNKAIVEIANALDAGRQKFQAKLVKAQTKPPLSLKTAAPTLLVKLTEQRDALTEAIAEADSEIARLQAELTPA